MQHLQKTGGRGPAMVTKVPFRPSRSQAGRSQFTRSASRRATSPLIPDSLHPGSPSKEPLPVLGALGPHLSSSPNPKEARHIPSSKNVRMVSGGDTVSTEAVAPRRHAGNHLPATWWKTRNANNNLALAA